MRISWSLYITAVNGGQIGLALSYISVLLGAFQLIVRKTAEVESYVSGHRYKSTDTLMYTNALIQNVFVKESQFICG